MKELIKRFIPPFLLSGYHFALAFLGALFYWFPSKKIKVVGVTGTNGKTTVTEMISKIFEEAGYKVALMNSIRFKIGKNEEPNLLKMTMPGRFKIQRFLRKAVDSGCQYAILEVTSEGIKQHRHRFIDFDIAVFTNLTPEHIEAHGSFEKYRQAKGKLFHVTKSIHVINLDDENSEYFLQFPSQYKNLYSLNEFRKYPATEHDTIIRAREIQILVNGLKFLINNIRFTLNLRGRFNVYNALAAICVGLSQGIQLKTCQRALEKIKGIPGRMEEVISQPFRAIVDYAVTPDSLEQVYQTVKNLYAPKRLICIFGACGGGRDKWKRPVLGKIASKYCQEIILTNEDPYDEDPIEIIEQIESGITNFKSGIRKILDRRKAIKKALELAEPGDTVIITGKGSEPWICFERSKKTPWDDRQVVREEFHELYHI